MMFWAMLRRVVTGRTNTICFYTSVYFFLEDANIGNAKVNFLRASANNDRDAAMGSLEWKATREP